MSGMQHHELTVGSFLDHAAKWHGTTEVVSVVDGQVVRTGYATLRERAGRLSAAFAALGIGRGDVVATLGWNTQAHLESWYAAAGIGAICHTLNPRLTPAQLAAMVAQSRPRLLVFGEGLAELAGEVAAAASLPTPVALDTADGVAALIAGQGEALAWTAVRETDPCGLCFTSGTTGAPKGVLYSHRSNHLHTLRLLQADALALTAADRVLAVVPMFHANGWGLPFGAPAVGAALILPGRQLAGAHLARLIVEEGVTVAAGVPTVWLDLLAHVEREGIALPSLRRIYLGGAALPVAVQARLEEGLGASIHTSWGMTELSPLGTVAPGGVGATLPGSSGRAPFGLDLRLTDAEGVPLAEQRGPSGHLQVRGSGVVRRYYGADADAADAEGWFDTGDLATIGTDGSLTITGRAKDLIKSGGEWINPAEIEAIVGALPGVALAAVVGRDDPRWGERPVLTLELRPGAVLSDAEVAAALDGRIARWWMPDAVIRLDRMPLAATGKIDKRAVRALVAASTSEVALQHGSGA